MPFRDKASQHFLKPTYRRGKEKEDVDGSEQQDEPESEPNQVPVYEDEAVDVAVDALESQDEEVEDEEAEVLILCLVSTDTTKLSRC